MPGWELHGWDGAQLGTDVPKLPGQDNHKEQLSGVCMSVQNPAASGCFP